MIEYTEDWLFALVFRRKGSVGGRACYFAVPCTIITVLILMLEDFFPGLQQSTGFMEASKSQLWTASTAVLTILLGFRTNRAMARFWEGTGLLHQMRGEWFDSVSCCVTFSRGAVSAKPREVKEFRHTIVRLMSLCHGSALEEIACEESDTLMTIDALGLDDVTLGHLYNCKEQYHFNRVEVLLHLIQSLITKSLADNILNVPAPILSRVYQTLSRGFVNLLNAKKISDTRFPFPYAQLISTLLMFQTVSTPLIITSLMQSKLWAAMFTFVPMFGMYSLNFVAVELENPFGDDDNDLPLEHFQSEMNSCLLMLLEDNADHIPGISPMRCITDFTALRDLAHGEVQPQGSTCRITRFAGDLQNQKPSQVQRDSLGSEFCASARSSAQSRKDSLAEDTSPIKNQDTSPGKHRLGSGTSDRSNEGPCNFANEKKLVEQNTHFDSVVKASNPDIPQDLRAEVSLQVPELPPPRPPPRTAEGASVRLVPETKIAAAVTLAMQARFENHSEEAWPRIDTQKDSLFTRGTLTASLDSTVQPMAGGQAPVGLGHDIRRAEENLQAIPREGHSAIVLGTMGR